MSLDILKRYASLNWQDDVSDGLMLAHLGEIDFYELAALRNEAKLIIERRESSDVQDPAHVTYWTKPKGVVRQWSLVNREGRTNCQAGDYDTGKPFVCREIAPVLNMFASEHEGLVNMRLNLMGPDSGLALHREATAILVDGKPRLKVRFHLPLFTSGSPCRLGNGVYEMNIGQVYLFNNGAPHASWNEGESERVHLVWDCLVTHKLLSYLENAEEVRPALALEVKAESHNSYPREACGVERAALERELDLCASLTPSS